MQLRESISLILKGIGMGAANVIPGVSGGTIALITGIFEKLINSIKSFDLKAVRLIMKGDFKGFFSSISPGLGLAFLGCVVVIVSYVLQRKSWGSISHVKENTKRLNNTSANKAIDEHEE